MRSSHREGTVGVPSTRSDRVRNTNRSGSGLNEIVGRQADPSLQRGKLNGLAHRTTQPGVRMGVGRPGTFVEATQNHHVCALKARLEATPIHSI